MRFKRIRKTKDTSSADSNAASTTDSNPIERLIDIKNCPLCHHPRLSSKAEIDIITHLAICASQDWNQVDRIVVGNFVTASQAQRKWYTKTTTKVSSGDYKLGAVSFNSNLVFCCSFSLLFYFYTPEFGEYHCTVSDDRTTRRREDASICTPWNSTLV